MVFCCTPKGLAKASEIASRTLILSGNNIFVVAGTHYASSPSCENGPTGIPFSPSDLSLTDDHFPTNIAAEDR